MATPFNTSVAGQDLISPQRGIGVLIVHRRDAEMFFVLLSVERTKSKKQSACGKYHRL
jgi:hypothetical protein